jgi:SAM-dependent methyltransferase
MTDDVVVSGYDAVYATLGASATFRRIWSESACGTDFPEGFDHISFLTRGEIGEVSDALRLSPDDVLVDLACGTGGPGLWVASTNRARLVGIDVSAVGIERARARAERLGLAHASTFAVGTFAVTGLADGTAGAAMTVDALQYAPDKRAALTEMARILRPGGRLAMTVFEVEAAKVAGLAVLGDDPVADYGDLLEAAGFDIERYEETEGWRDRVTEAYGRVLASADALTIELGDEAMAALAFEMATTLELDPYPRRVLAVASRR